MIISDVMVVVSFRQDNFIGLKKQKIDQYFGRVVPKPSVAADLADSADAALPRFTIKDGAAAIGVSQVSAHLFAALAKGIEFKTAQDSVLKYLEGLYAAAAELQGKQNILNTGLIATFIKEIPGARYDGLCSSLFKAYSSMEPLGDILNYTFRSAFKTRDNLFLGLDAGAYERKDEKGALSGGYILKADINDKPASVLSAGYDADAGIASIKKAFISLAEGVVENIFKKI